MHAIFAFEIKTTPKNKKQTENILNITKSKLNFSNNEIQE